MNKYGIPVDIVQDTIKSGGLFNSSQTPCISISPNDKKKRYKTYVITVQQQGIFSIVTTYVYGFSESQYEIEKAEAKRQSALGMMFAKGPNPQKLAEEENYYSVLEDCIMSIFNKDVADIVALLNLV